MNYDFTTLAGINAAAEELNTKAEALGLDLDIAIHPEEDRVEFSFWTKAGEDYNQEWREWVASTAESLARIFEDAGAFIQEYKKKYKQGRLTALAQRAEKIEAELAAIREELDKENA